MSNGSMNHEMVTSRNHNCYFHHHIHICNNTVYAVKKHTNMYADDMKNTMFNNLLCVMLISPGHYWFLQKVEMDSIHFVPTCLGVLSVVPWSYNHLGCHQTRHSRMTMSECVQLATIFVTFCHCDLRLVSDSHTNHENAGLCHSRSRVHAFDIQCRN